MILEDLGRVLGGFVGSWGCFGVAWKDLAWIMGDLGGFWGHLGRSWRGFGGFLRNLAWRIWRGFWRDRENSWGIFWGGS